MFKEDTFSFDTSQMDLQPAISSKASENINGFLDSSDDDIPAEVPDEHTSIKDEAFVDTALANLDVHDTSNRAASPADLSLTQASTSRPTRTVRPPVWMHIILIPLSSKDASIL